MRYTFEKKVMSFIKEQARPAGPMNLLGSMMVTRTWAIFWYISIGSKVSELVIVGVLHFLVFDGLDACISHQALLLRFGCFERIDHGSVFLVLVSAGDIGQLLALVAEILRADVDVHIVHRSLPLEVLSLADCGAQLVGPLHAFDGCVVFAGLDAEQLQVIELVGIDAVPSGGAGAVILVEVVDGVVIDATGLRHGKLGPLPPDLVDGPADGEAVVMQQTVHCVKLEDVGLEGLRYGGRLTGGEEGLYVIGVGPPSVEATCLILEGLRDSFEKHHRVHYEKGAIEAAVTLADRYISDRFLPDKAIDVIDAAGARARMCDTQPPVDTKPIEEELEQAAAKKSEAIEAQNFEDAAQWRDKERDLRTKLEKMLNSRKDRQDSSVTVVTAEDMAAVVSTMTGIPLKRISSDMSVRLLTMESEIEKTVIGQPQAVKAIADVLRRRFSGLSCAGTDRPIGTFLFLGPTGVGKTLLAKALAKFMFGDPNAMVRVDMASFRHEADYTRLIGSGAGYVDSDKGGQLTEPIRRRPYSVVLLDEFEKAHPRIQNVFLRLFDEGWLTDAMGRQVDFRNTVIIATSNMGAGASAVSLAPLGFGAISEDKTAVEAQDDKSIAAAKRELPPELFNRFDKMIAFNALGRDELSIVVKLELDKLRANLSSRGWTLEITDSAIEFLVNAGYQPEFGARPIRRAIENWIETPLAGELLAGTFNTASGIKIDKDETEEKLCFTAADTAESLIKSTENS